MIEQIITGLQSIKARKMADSVSITAAIELMKNQQQTILRQRKQLADLQRKQEK